MSAETNIKNAYEQVGAEVLSIKRKEGTIYRVEIQIHGKRMKFFAKDPDKSSFRDRRQFEMGLRAIERGGTLHS